MLHAFNYATGKGIQVMEGAEGMRLLGDYKIGLMEAGNGNGNGETAVTFSAGADYVCTGATVCNPKTDAATQAYKDLQDALNRASAQFVEAGQGPIKVDGTINPDVLVAAWRLAKHLGPDADPLFKIIGDMDIFNAAQVSALASQLATDPIGAQNAFDKVTIAAATEEKRYAQKVARRRGWLAALAVVTSIGAITGSVIYARRARRG